MYEIYLKALDGDFIMEYFFIVVLLIIAASLKSSLSDKEKELKDFKGRYKDARAYEQQVQARCEQQVEETKQYIKKGQEIYSTEVHNAREVEEKKKFIESFLSSRIKDFPIVATPLADYLTAKDDASISYLENKIRSAPKAADEVRMVKQEKKKLIAENKAYKWEIEYLRQLLPWLEELEELPIEPQIDVYNSNNQYDDDAGYWLTPQEYAQLSNVEKYQLALDRYKKRKKSKVEIGYEYERYIGYGFEKKGFKVTYHGIEEGVKDLGIDLIATKGRINYIIQCKCWSKKKEIHEKYINQHIGTTLKYYLEHNPNPNATIADFFTQDITKSDFVVLPLFYTTAPLSPVAEDFAIKLGVMVMIKPLEEYPLIKCNINRSTGDHIYHLPFDQQYDKCKICDKGEFYAETVAEAEKAGFRRAMRWHGNNNFTDGYIGD